LAAASEDDDNNGDFFSSDEKGGNFFEEVEKPGPKQQKGNDEEDPMPLEELEMLATDFDEHLPKINTVSLVGRVGNDPEPRYFDDGKVVLNLSLAVRRKYHPLERKVREIRSGEEETDWFPLEFWGRDAEYVTNYVEKGARIGITGSLVMDGWVDKMTGEQRRKAKVVVRHIDILESKAEAELRKSGKESYVAGSGGGRRYDDDDEDGTRPAGTGGFFS
jgi:single-strand DNA-binding protein